MALCKANPISKTPSRSSFLHSFLSLTYAEIFLRFDQEIFVTDGIVKLLSKKLSKLSGKRCSRMETSDCPSLQMDKTSHEKNLGIAVKEQAETGFKLKAENRRDSGTLKLGRRLVRLERSSALSVDVANMCDSVIWIMIIGLMSVSQSVVNFASARLRQFLRSGEGFQFVVG